MNRRFRKKYRYSRHKSIVYLFVVLLLCGLGLGYASIKTDLSIIGTSKFINASWDVHFENIQVKTGSITPTTPATITDDTTVTFSAQLEEPGEFYEFTIDVVNEGTLDAMIGSLTIQPTLSSAEQEYFDYIVTYEDGTPIAINHKLEAGDTETLRIAFIYKTLQDTSLYPTEDEDYTVSVSINYVQEGDTAIDVPHPPTLYDVLKTAASQGTYAKEYTGPHQDSFNGTGTKKIYHWYSTNNTMSGTVRNMSYVVFGGHCWQMIRTTDTGGVKMIYNGEAQGNQCLTETHIGYDSRTAQNLANNYYYGTSYTYDSTNNVFSLSGTLEQATWSESLAPNLIGKYTCKQTTEAGTCSTLYLVESYYNTSSAYVIRILKNSNFSRFGKLEYNIPANSLAYVGYMYNTVYLTETFHFLSSNITSAYTSNISDLYYYSDTIDYGNLNAGKYTLINPQLVSDLSNYNELVGKYIVSSSTDQSTVARYITAINNNKYRYKELKEGDLITSLTIGDNYTESGGIYTLSGNVTYVPYENWYNATDLSIYKGKYVCDGNNTSCTIIKHIYDKGNLSSNSYSYVDSTWNYYYSDSITYGNGIYTLSGNMSTFWDFFDSSNLDYISTHHYTCFDSGTTCTTAGYIFGYDQSNIHYLVLTDVEDIDTAIYNMLHASNVNTKNSIIKTAIDAWYAKYLISYDDYIEDTVFCNDRTILSLGSWDPNGGDISDDTSSNYLVFNQQWGDTDLSCESATDQFSTLNPNARLTYKVGLISTREMNLITHYGQFTSDMEYFTISPGWVSNNGYSTVFFERGSGGSGRNAVNSIYGVRPVISLKPGTTYVSGSGSSDNPYVVG